MSFRNAMFCAGLLLIGATSVSSADEHLVRVSALDKAACMPDAVRLCRDAMPNVYNILACFGRNREKISSRCLAVLASHGLQ